MRIIVVILVLLFGSSALARNLVIYPFSSQDVLLGVALADKLAEALENALEVIGPDISPNLAAPLIADGGFFSLLRLSEPLDTPEGARLLLEVYGADQLISGSVRFIDGSLEAEVLLIDGSRTRSFRVSAAADDPALLARKIIAVISSRLGVSASSSSSELDLSGSYGDYVRAVALVGGGELNEALSLINSVPESVSDEPRLAALKTDLETVSTADTARGSLRLATMSLNLIPLDETLSIGYFQEAATTSSLPVIHTWIATLHASAQEDTLAQTAFDRAAETSAYGRAARLAYRTVMDLDTGSDAEVLLSMSNRAALLSLALLANMRDNTELEKQSLRQLTQVAPRFIYPFERLSFIAFDEDDAMAAAEALAVAVRLVPESDLYWTNYGWATYLLGLLEQSEEASLRAIELDPNQFIAFYNLGLTRAVTGRLAQAMDAYSRALALDPQVDDEAIIDLENALELFPKQVGVHFALATLYEQKGRREEAAIQFETYLARGEAPFTSQAQARITVLRAPPPPLEISAGARLGLGANLLGTAPFQPGDRLYLAFELYTPGTELPGRISVRASLQDSTGAVLSEREIEVSPPRNAIGYVVNNLSLDLPTDLPAAEYQVIIEASAAEQKALSSLSFAVDGEVSFIRQLISRDISMLELETGSSLYDASDLGRSDEVLIGKLLTELRFTADVAEEALEGLVISEGRFAGQSGGEMFAGSSAEDVSDFLTFFLSGSAASASFTFVDAYAQWAIDGAASEQ